MYHGTDWTRKRGDDVANIRSEAETRALYKKVLTAATALFIQKGFERTTLMDIAKLSGVSKRVIIYEMNSKEGILVHLVDEFLDRVTQESDAEATKHTDDKLLIFMANEVLQIYMAEMSEDMRNLYLSAYSMPKTSEEVLRCRSAMLFERFGYMFPSFELKDFYELEIATMGIMRAYMSVPCDIYFTLEAKTDRLISTMLKIYDLDKKEISRVKDFIKEIDFEELARKTVDDVFDELNIRKGKTD